MDCLVMSGLFAGSLFIRKGSLLQELAVLACVSYTILGDERLSANACLILSVCSGFLFTCHVVVLSAAVERNPKPSAAGKAFALLLDCDFELQDKYEPVSSQQTNCISGLFKNSYQFCKFRPIYGLLVLVGVIFLALIFSFRFLVEGAEIQEDLQFASIVLIVPAIFLVAVPLFVANSEIYVDKCENAVYAYRPFQEKVEVPMRVVAGKTLAVFATSGCENVISTLMILAGTFLSVGCLAFVYTMTVEEAKEMQELYEHRLLIFKSVRSVVCSLLTFSTVSGVYILSGKVMVSWAKAKWSIFGIIEINWRWNLGTMEYLLPDVEVSTLEDLQSAVEAKKTQQLTVGEKLALDYLEQPLWKTRVQFVDKVGLSGLAYRFIGVSPTQQKNGRAASDSDSEQQ